MDNNNKTQYYMVANIIISDEWTAIRSFDIMYKQIKYRIDLLFIEIFVETRNKLLFSNKFFFIKEFMELHDLNIET